VSWTKPDASRVKPCVVDGVPFPGGMDQVLTELFELCVEAACRRTGYRLHDGWCWGQFVKMIVGSGGILSFHGQGGGKAGDINAPVNGRGTKGNLPRKFVRLMERYGWTWGGRWSYTDPMHFERHGSIRAAKRDLRRAKRQLGQERQRWYWRVGDAFFGEKRRAESYLRGKLKSKPKQFAEAEVHRTRLSEAKNGKR
jgi:D-alanyl-D-alanine carboxypeptidase-like protein